jgi:hypothetical protein
MACEIRLHIGRIGARLDGRAQAGRCLLHPAKRLHSDSGTWHDRTGTKYFRFRISVLLLMTIQLQAPEQFKMLIMGSYGADDSSTRETIHSSIEVDAGPSSATWSHYHERSS